jgi:hypothetical protein
VGSPALIAAMQDAIPPYRAQHIETNRQALEAGSAVVAERVVDAWAKRAA